MSGINLPNLRAYFYRPSQKMIEQEAGLQPGYLYKVLNGKRELTPAIIAKLKPVLEKYNF